MDSTSAYETIIRDGHYRNYNLKHLWVTNITLVSGSQTVKEYD